MQLSTFYKESTSGPRAEVHKTSDGYDIQYYDIGGVKIRTESISGKTQQEVEGLAENWTMRIDTLNG